MIIQTACQRCAAIFDAHSFRARYCSDRCRKQAARARAKEVAQAEITDAEQVTADSPPEQSHGLLYAATLAELRTAKREGTALGIGALYLAQQIDMLGSSPGALPGLLVAQHAAALARATGGASGPSAVAGLADIIGGAGGLVALRGGRS